MTDIEKKALALLIEIDPELADWGPDDVEGLVSYEALCRAIERHEAFRQEVSDAVRVLDEFITGSEDYKRGSRTDGVHLSDGRSVKFARFIIADPDPLVEAWMEAWPNDPLEAAEKETQALRAAIAKRGGKITWGEG